MLEQALALSSSEAAAVPTRRSARDDANGDLEAALRASAALARESTGDADLARALAESARQAALEEERHLARYARRAPPRQPSGVTRSSAAIPAILHLARSDVVQLRPAGQYAPDDVSSESDGGGISLASLFPWEGGD